MIGQNFDYGVDLPDFLLISSLDGAYKSTGHYMFQLHQWMMDGVNEKGPFMGLASTGNPPAYAYGACRRYRTATDQLQRGVSSLPDLIGIMESVRQISGEHRTFGLTNTAPDRMISCVDYACC